MFVETVESEVRTMDKVKNITDLQAELDRRTAVEKLAEKLIIDGKFEEAKELLDTLDDKKVMELAEGVVAAEKKSADCESKKAIDLYLKVNCNSDIPKHNFEKLNDVINEIVALQEKGTKLNVRILANMK